MFACEITCTAKKPLKQSAMMTSNCSLYVPFVGSIKPPHQLLNCKIQTLKTLKLLSANYEIKHKNISRTISDDTI